MPNRRWLYAVQHGNGTVVCVCDTPADVLFLAIVVYASLPVLPSGIIGDPIIAPVCCVRIFLGWVGQEEAGRRQAHICC